MQPEAAVQQQLLPAGAKPDTDGQVGWFISQPFHLRHQDLQLLLVEKLSFLGDVNAVCLGHLVFLEDHTTPAIFLANTCASVSLVPGPASPQGLLLTATNGGHHHWS